MTGLGARMPDRPDLAPSMEKLDDAGRVHLDGWGPARQRQLIDALDRRMARFPLFSDASMSVLLDDRLPRFGGFLPAGAIGSAVLVLRAEPGDDIARFASAHGAIAPTHRPWSSAGRHESFHAVGEALRRIPGVREEIERRVGQVLGDPSYRFGAGSRASKVEIVRQIGAYGACNDLVDVPGFLGDTSPDRAWAEQGAEALMIADEFGDAAPPLSRVWDQVAELLLGAASPLAPDLNEALFVDAALTAHRERTGPEGLRRSEEEVRRSLPPDLARAILSCPDLRAEHAEEHRLPDWLRERASQPVFAPELLQRVRSMMEAHPVDLTVLQRPHVVSGAVLDADGGVVWQHRMPMEWECTTAWDPAPPHLRDRDPRYTPAERAWVEAEAEGAHAAQVEHCSSIGVEPPARYVLPKAHPPSGIPRRARRVGSATGAPHGPLPSTTTQPPEPSIPPGAGTDATTPSHHAAARRRGTPPGPGTLL